MLVLVLAMVMRMVMTMVTRLALAAVHCSGAAAAAAADPAAAAAADPAAAAATAARVAHTASATHGPESERVGYEPVRVSVCVSGLGPGPGPGCVETGQRQLKMLKSVPPSLPLACGLTTASYRAHLRVFSCVCACVHLCS